MSALKNPYLSNQTQNLLLRKNFNVIKSPQKTALYPAYTSKITTSYYYNTTINTHNHESSTSIGNKSSSMSLHNPFSTKTLGQRNQNYPYYHTNAPSFYTQTYLPSTLKKQLPFPSYNRPTSNRGASFSSNKIQKIISLSKRNQPLSHVGITEASSLQKNISTPYRPHFLSPKHNHQWNTDKWKTQLQKKERNNLKLFGPDALRYQGKIDIKFNHQYYSTSNINAQFKYRINPSQKTQNIKKVKNIMSFDDDFDANQSIRPGNKNQYPMNIDKSSLQNSLAAPQDPDTYRKSKNHVNIKNFSDVHEKSKAELHRQNSESMVEEYSSFAKEHDENQNKFMSKYEEKNEKKKRGPLDLDAFDSGSSNSLMNESRQKDLDVNLYGSGTFGKPERTNFRQEDSSVFRANNTSSKDFYSNQRYKHDSKMRQSVQSVTQRDFPQRIEYSNKIYYRIKLNEDKR